MASLEVSRILMISRYPQTSEPDTNRSALCLLGITCLSHYRTLFTGNQAQSLSRNYLSQRESPDSKNIFVLYKQRLYLKEIVLLSIVVTRTYLWLSSWLQWPGDI